MNDIDSNTKQSKFVVKAIATTSIALWLVWGCPAQAASFDCAKAQSFIEQMICNNSKLSKLDEDLSANYKIALQDKSNAKALKKEQLAWLNEVNACPDAECVSSNYAGRIVMLQNRNASFILTQRPAQQKVQQDRKAGFKGEYFLIKSEDLICLPFTKNLNEFRKLDFDDCAPRLSENFSEISRPEWKEVPLDLEIAEKTFKGFGGSNLKPGEGIYWKNWLKETENLRTSGQVKMWLTDADINNDGIPDPIARVQYANPASDLPVKQRGCLYTQSGLWKLSPSPEYFFGPEKHFYFGGGSDIIYLNNFERFYSVEFSQVAFDPDMVGQKIGATRGVIIKLAREARSSPLPMCYINWVPTGSYRPLQRNTKSTQSNKEPRDTTGIV